ncbi:MAG: TerB family tellurite resistance protein [Sulfurimonas sp.]|jgi:uncharacterized tellurite resistance protein B-like protein
MGFFSKSKKTVSPQGALVLAMMEMIEIDGDIDDDELAILERILNNSDEAESFEELDKLRDDTEIMDLIELIANSLNEQQRITVIANLLDTAMADGVLGDSEKLLLKAFINGFKMDSDDVETIIRVIAIKNRAL